MSGDVEEMQMKTSLSITLYSLQGSNYHTEHTFSDHWGEHNLRRVATDSDSLRLTFLSKWSRDSVRITCAWKQFEFLMQIVTQHVTLKQIAPSSRRETALKSIAHLFHPLSKVLHAN